MADTQGPFGVYEDYEGGLHIIDKTTRIVLSDSYAYDASKEERSVRMGNIARALSICYGATPESAKTNAELTEALGHSQRFLKAEMEANREHAERNVKALDLMGIKHPGLCNSRVWGGGVIEGIEELIRERDEWKRRAAAHGCDTEKGDPDCG